MVGFQVVGGCLGCWILSCGWLFGSALGGWVGGWVGGCKTVVWIGLGWLVVNVGDDFGGFRLAMGGFKMCLVVGLAVVMGG